MRTALHFLSAAVCLAIAAISHDVIISSLAVIAAGIGVIATIWGRRHD